MSQHRTVLVCIKETGRSMWMKQRLRVFKLNQVRNSLFQPVLFPIACFFCAASSELKAHWSLSYVFSPLSCREKWKPVHPQPSFLFWFLSRQEVQLIKNSWTQERGREGVSPSPNAPQIWCFRAINTDKARRRENRKSPFPQYRRRLLPREQPAGPLIF